MYALSYLHHTRNKNYWIQPLYIVLSVYMKNLYTSYIFFKSFSTQDLLISLLHILVHYMFHSITYCIVLTLSVNIQTYLKVIWRMTGSSKADDLYVSIHVLSMLLFKLFIRSIFIWIWSFVNIHLFCCNICDTAMCITHNMFQ